VSNKTRAGRKIIVATPISAAAIHPTNSGPAHCSKEALENLQPRIELPEDLRLAASKPIKRMLDWSSR